MSSTNSPCAACKFLRRKCTQECVFSPYFPPDEPQKFASVHKVFGASNVAKILHDLDTTQREDAVNSLAYEADMRLRDPVYGCVGLISLLQHKLKQLQNDLYNARKELANYIGPQAMVFNSQAAGYKSGVSGSKSMMGNVRGISGVGGGQVVFHEQSQPQHQYHQQIFEAQRPPTVAAATREHHEMFRAFQLQPQQPTQLGGGGGGSRSVISFNQLSSGGGETLSPSLTLGTFENPNYHHNDHHQLNGQLLVHHPLREEKLLLQTQRQARSESDEGSSGGPSYN